MNDLLLDSRLEILPPYMTRAGSSPGDGRGFKTEIISNLRLENNTKQQLKRWACVSCCLSRQPTALTPTLLETKSIYCCLLVQFYHHKSAYQRVEQASKDQCDERTAHNNYVVWHAKIRRCEVNKQRGSINTTERRVHWDEYGRR